MYCTRPQKARRVRSYPDTAGTPRQPTQRLSVRSAPAAWTVRTPGDKDWRCRAPSRQQELEWSGRLVHMEGPLDVQDCRSGVCVLHNLEPMLMTQYVTVRLSDGSDYNAFRCSIPECRICFSPLRGYEFVEDGGYRQVAHDLLRHPRCSEHELYMLLMMPTREGVYEWACPVKSCDQVRNSPQPPSDN